MEVGLQPAFFIIISKFSLSRKAGDPKLRDLFGTLSALFAPVCESLDCYIYDIDVSRSGKDKVLCVYIDREGGMDVDTCEKFSRAVDPILDENEPFDVPYVFEVSSPGIERVLRLDDHFTWAIGQMITLKLYKPMNGSKTHVVRLTDYQNKELSIETQDGTVASLPRDAVASARIWYDFSRDLERKD